jgi:hypothetical protein
MGRKLYWHQLWSDCFLSNFNMTYFWLHVNLCLSSFFKIGYLRTVYLIVYLMADPLKNLSLSVYSQLWSWQIISFIIVIFFLLFFLFRLKTHNASDMLSILFLKLFLFLVSYYSFQKKLVDRKLTFCCFLACSLLAFDIIIAAKYSEWMS